MQKSALRAPTQPTRVVCFLMTVWRDATYVYLPLRPQCGLGGGGLGHAGTADGDLPAGCGAKGAACVVVPGLLLSCTDCRPKTPLFARPNCCVFGGCVREEACVCFALYKIWGYLVFHCSSQCRAVSLLSVPLREQFGVVDPRPTHERVHEVAFSSSKKKMEVRSDACWGAVTAPVTTI